MNNKTNIKPCAYCQDLEDRHMSQMRQTTSFGGLNNIIALPIPLAIFKK